MRANQFIEELRGEVDVIQAQVDAIVENLQDAEASLSEVDDEKAELWLTISETQSQSSRKGEGGASNSRVERLLAEREQAAARVDAKKDVIRAHIAKHRGKLANAIERRDKVLLDHQNAERHLEWQLQNDEHYVSLAEAAEAAQAKVNDFERRLAEAEDERSEKLPSYESDPVFLHLKDRGYGTPEYRPPLATARLDRWLARVDGYLAAKKNYDLLNEMPGWLKNKLQQAIAEAEQAEYARSLYEQTQRESHDVAAIDQILDEVEARVQKAQLDVDRLVEMGRTLDNDRAVFSRRQDEFSAEIRDVYMTMYGDMSLQDLLKMAKSTASKEDERAVQRLQEIERETLPLRDEIDQKKRQMREAANRRDRIMALIEELRQSGLMTSRFALQDEALQRESVRQLMNGYGTVPGVAGKILDGIKPAALKMPTLAGKRGAGEEAFPGT